MKKAVKRFLDYFEAKQSKDEIKGCLSLILNGNDTAQSIYIFNEVKLQFENILIDKRETAIKEVANIESYFSGRVKNPNLKNQNYQFK